MRYMLDTNICIYAIKNRPPQVLEHLRKHMSKQYDMMKTIRSFADHAYAAQVAGVTPQQIIGIQAKNDLPQIKFFKDYKPELERIQKAMDSEFTRLRSSV